MYCRIFTFFALLLLSVSCCHMYAQRRICDLEALCISPSDTVINGGALPLRFGRKNLGPDIMFKNDTTYYRVYRVVKGQEITDYSGAFIGGGGINDTVSVGDSTIYRDNYSIRFDYPDLKEPLVLDYCGQIDSWKRNAWGDTIGFSYYDTNAENNKCCKKVVVMPQPATLIAAAEADTGDCVLYPNPAKELLQVSINRRRHSGALEVIVSSVDGRIWLQQHYSANNEISVVVLDIRQLPPGIYSLNVRSAGRCIIKRFAVVR